MVHGLGLEAAQGLVLTESYYWDLNDRTREFGERFFKRTGRMPNWMVHAVGLYSRANNTWQTVVNVPSAPGFKADADAINALRVTTLGGKISMNGAAGRRRAQFPHGHVQANGRHGVRPLSV